MERLAFAPSGGPAPTSEGCCSETRPLASRPDCQNSIWALLRLQGVPTTVYCQNPGSAIHLVHWVLNCIFKLVDFLSSGMETPWSHFAPTCITVLKQLLSKSEKRFVRTHWLQEGLGLSEALCVNLCEFRFVCWKVWGSIPKI